MMVHQTEITPLESVRLSPFGDGRHLRAHPARRFAPLPTKLIGRLAPLLSGVEQDSIHIQERHSEGTRATGTGLASRLRLWEGAPVARQPDATPTYRGSLEPSSVSGVKVRREQLLRSQPSVSQV